MERVIIYLFSGTLSDAAMWGDGQKVARAPLKRLFAIESVFV